MKLLLKILALFVIGLSLTAMAKPAQASSLTAPQVSAIISLLQSFGADRSVINNVSAALGGQTSSGQSCASFSDASYGNFDDALGGPVSQLQTWLGIPSSSFGFGTYGRKTQAAWNSRCGTNPNPQPTPLPQTTIPVVLPTSGAAPVMDMTRYMDRDFGFTFYYPSGWRVSKFANTVSISDPNGDTPMVAITEVSGNVVTDASLLRNDTFEYDPSTGKWMDKFDASFSGGGTGVNEAVSVATTVGGFAEFQGSSKYGALVVPLSRFKILKLSSPSGAGSFVGTLAGTLTSTHYR